MTAQRDAGATWQLGDLEPDAPARQLAGQLDAFPDLEPAARLEPVQLVIFDAAAVQ